MERQLKIQLPDEALANVVTVQNLLDEVATRQVAS
jgi:acyl carrier protein